MDLVVPIVIPDFDVTLTGCVGAENKSGSGS